MRAVRLVHVSESSCAWHFQSCGDSALQSSPFAIQYRFLRIHFSSHSRLLYPHLLGTTINIQFEFSIRENERIWLLPKNYPRLSCIEPGKQYQRHKTMAILFNCNLQMELKFIRRTFSPAQCPYCVSGCGRSDKIHDYRKWKHINNAFITSNILNIFLITPPTRSKKHQQFFCHLRSLTIRISNE